MKEVDPNTALGTSIWIRPSASREASMVTCKGKDGKDNIITVGMSMQGSLSPVSLVISIGKTRLSHQLILESNEFVLCIPSTEQLGAVQYCGTHSGRDVDKFTETGLIKIKSKHIGPPLITNSIACFECRVSGKLETGDHTIFIGDVLAAYIHE